MTVRRLAILLLLPLLLWSPSARAADPVPIGFLGTFSGVGATVGRDALDGFELVLSELTGRFAGVQVEAVPVDVGRDAGAALAETRRMLAEGVRLFVLASAAPEANAAAAGAATAAGAFVLAVSESPVALAEAGCSPFLFSLAPHRRAEQAAIARYFGEVGYRRVWLVIPDTESGRAGAEIFRAYHAGEIVGETLVPGGTMAFAPLLVPVDRAAGELDAVYSLLGAGLGVNYLRQYVARGLNQRVAIFAPGSFLDQPHTAAAGDAAVNAIAVAPWVEDIEVPANQRMVADFESAYGRTPSIYAAYGYDAARLLDAAWRHSMGEDAPKDPVEAFRAGLRRAEFDSVRGWFRFSGNHFPAQNWYLLQTVRTPSGRIGNEMRLVLLKEHRDPHAAACPMKWQDPLAPPPAPGKKPVSPAAGGRR